MFTFWSIKLLDRTNATFGIPQVSLFWWYQMADKFEITVSIVPSWMTLLLDKISFCTTLCNFHLIQGLSWMHHTPRHSHWLADCSGDKTYLSLSKRDPSTFRLWILTYAQKASKVAQSSKRTRRWEQHVPKSQPSIPTVNLDLCRQKKIERIRLLFPLINVWTQLWTALNTYSTISEGSKSAYA